MYSINQRFSTVANQSLSYGLLIIAIIVGTSYYQLQSSNAFNNLITIGNINPTFAIRTSRYYGSTNGKPKENVKLTFDLDTDLTSLFNWNTKQVFVYLVAEYKGQKHPAISNTVTFWDKIITTKKDAILHLVNEKGKYNVWDLEDKFQNRDLEFSLHWNLQPWVGPLIYGETVGNTSIVLTKPEKKKKKNTGQEESVKENASVDE
ncbi:hypothetical protein TBLA_0D02410 [Henningerozyma blattae CBS 6284]|uniref:Signal peptidase subunit 3 n=1 Tax=Henningerozyma blattae (strain ATCC 34711 / CBS 6284 / DSM 70876 / NBRC 10599 / NRRL Y-10934 / UCD 77-7) TaxID=1071380 RepID=I2H2Z3_HENB6|nr:hypothetical protein TBLA_0D02410 [Tetrapisispora blattae CBS 6284]CCH60745.1 hypothetical protein TBLA_0D02410 [Tetrapisispora blattae CBS 6284]